MISYSIVTKLLTSREELAEFLTKFRSGVYPSRRYGGLVAH